MLTRFPPSDDLVLARLIEDAVSAPPDIKTVEEAVKVITNGPPPVRRKGGQSVLHSLRKGRVTPETTLSLIRALEAWGDLVVGGVATLTDIHVAPAREVHLPDSAVLLGSYEIDGHPRLVTVTWKTKAAGTVSPTLAHVDDFHLVHDRLRLERLLRAWAMETSFRPERPLVRAACVVTPNILTDLRG
ncbi:MAG: hypothetical protein ACRD1T_16325, partial [Acidimicrobiia bacterium]